jgi:drug/metabolite transporter (DMT)-like permease
MIFVVPILGILWSALLLGEPVTLAAVIGAAMIIGGNVWLRLAEEATRRSGYGKQE